MSWIILWANGEELQRLELKKPVVVGRSAECDVAIRDVLMSRMHCRFEPLGNGWRVVDLQSKNGTRVGWQRVQAHVLRDGDWLRMGRTRVTFHAGEFVPATGPSRKKNAGDRMVRPADPHEALSGTVTDFIVLDDDVQTGAAPEDCWGLPIPRPRPLEPASYNEPAVETLIESLAASAAEAEAAGTPWTSGGGGTATRARIRPLPRVPVRPIHREIPHLRTPAADSSVAGKSPTTPTHLSRRTRARRPMRALHQRLLTAAVVAVGAAVGTAIVFMSAWLLTLAP